VIFVMKYSTRN